MLAGVNGAGKTTSIGKLAKYLQGQGHSVLLAAGDTFRAAAREQLEVWGARNDVHVIAQHGGDPAAVMFDAIAAARARGIDVVLADTAGRLPTQLHLMEELKKIRRVIDKAQPGAPHETLLVLDANTGQNALAQVAAFDAALGLTGLILTKLDGTAKGGVVAAIAKTTPIPVKLIGVGEGVDDLRPFRVGGVRRRVGRLISSRATGNIHIAQYVKVAAKTAPASGPTGPRDQDAGTSAGLSTLSTPSAKMASQKEIRPMTTATTLAFPTPTSLGSLDHYVQAVNRFPLLTAEQEIELGRRLQRDNDVDAARQLVLSHLRLVVSVSRNYLGYGLPQADLIQEGNIGLMKAVRRFDPERGVRLVSFALHWIRAEMHEYILRNWRLVKIATTKAQRKLFFNLRSMKPRAGTLTPTEASDIATALSVKPEEVIEMETRLSGQDVALDPQAGDEGEVDDADRLPHRHRGRASADSRARRNRTQSQRRACVMRCRARRPQPRHHRGALAARGRPGDAAGPRRSVRRFRRADPADREQGAQDDARADRRCLTRA